ncbi:MAG: hypothetical protein AB7S80_18460 [Rhizobiaceae bacterium]
MASQVAFAEDDGLLGFLAGDYTIVGREPGDGPAYAGTATIAASGDGLLLQRSRDGKSIKAEGKLEVPSPPGEGQVLNFRWSGPQPMLLSCLIGSDLDNYARLTCLWGRADQPGEKPGLEAMFAVK